MTKRRRKFSRPPGIRRYRKIFLISTEGSNTEVQYFSYFNNESSVVKIKCLKGKHESSPAQVFKRMKNNLEKERIIITDEAWLVVDRDQWTEGQLSDLNNWSKSQSNYGFALSNPKFEYWLLLHFEEGRGITSSRICSERLRRYIPDYNKNIDPRKIIAHVEDAIRRARHLDNPPCDDWPRTTGTTVYKLVERILGNSPN